MPRAVVCIAATVPNQTPNNRSGKDNSLIVGRWQPLIPPTKAQGRAPHPSLFAIPKTTSLRLSLCRPSLFVAPFFVNRLNFLFGSFLRLLFYIIFIIWMLSYSLFSSLHNHLRFYLYAIIPSYFSSVLFLSLFSFVAVHLLSVSYIYIYIYIYTVYLFRSFCLLSLFISLSSISI